MVRYRIVPFKLGKWAVQEETYETFGRFVRYGFLYLKERYVRDSEVTYIGWVYVYNGGGYALFDTKEEAKEFIDLLITDEIHMETPPEEYP